MFNIMKSILYLTIIFILIASLNGCGNSESNNSDETQQPTYIPETRRDGAGEQAVPGEKVREKIEHTDLQTHS